MQSFTHPEPYQTVVVGSQLLQLLRLKRLTSSSRECFEQGPAPRIWPLVLPKVVEYTPSY